MMTVMRSVLSGFVALPRFLKMVELLQTDSWLTQETLPVEIDLGNDYIFHTVFVCPVSRMSYDDVIIIIMYR